MQGNKGDSCEDKIVKKITAKLKKRLDDDKYLKTRYCIDHHINVLKDITVMLKEPSSATNRSKEFKILFGAAEQDIVVYHKDVKLNVPFNEGCIEKAKSSFPKKSRTNHVSHIVVPVMIFEVKCDNVNTHSITHYSSMAQQIKDKFPGVFYNLVLLDTNKLSETLIRHGKSFNKIMPFDKNNKDSDSYLDGVADRCFSEIKHEFELRSVQEYDTKL